MGMHPDEQGIRSAVMGLVGESEELDSPQELNAVETDPSKRYTRFDVVLGRGAYKTVYKAFDEWEGIEVAWNQVKVNDLVSQRTERERLFAEIRVLKQLKHKNIMSSFDSWLDQKDLTVNFITELFTSGTLRQYRKRHKHIDEQVVKRWAWQILQGLVYLHGHNPPIIHRDLKCDNIFVNGASGVIKIGDLGLATLWHGLTTPQSVLGTPEFMAPELYEEKYNEKVDVYSFGMCMLELTTMEYPYSECRNAAQIYKKVTSGVKPAGLSRVQSVEMREFIEHCIQHDASKRPEARQLLKSTFFDSVRGGRMSSNGSRHRMQERAPCGEAGKIPARSSSSSASDEEILPNYHNELEQHSVLGQKQLSATEGSFRHVQSLQPQHSASSSTSSYQSEAYSGGPSSQELGRHVWNKMPLQEQHQLVREFGVECKDAHDNKYVFTLRFLEPTGHCKTIEFEFDQLEDTAEAVAGEMMEELSLSKHEADVIVEKITGELNRKAWAIEAARQRQQELGHQSRPPSPSASHVGAATTPAPHAITITPPPSGYTSGAISPSGPSGERGLVSPPDTPVPHPQFSARRSLPDAGGAAAADRGGQRPQSGPQSPASEGRMLSLNRLVEAMRAVHAENEAAAVAERLIRSTSSTIAFGGAAPGTAAVGRASTGILAPPKPHAAYPLP